MRVHRASPEVAGGDESVDFHPRRGVHISVAAARSVSASEQFADCRNLKQFDQSLVASLRAVFESAGPVDHGGEGHGINDTNRAEGSSRNRRR